MFKKIETSKCKVLNISGVQESLRHYYNLTKSALLASSAQLMRRVPLKCRMLNSIPGSNPRDQEQPLTCIPSEKL